VLTRIGRFFQGFPFLMPASSLRNARSDTGQAGNSGKWIVVNILSLLRVYSAPPIADGSFPDLHYP
jgi:hypothetical protein